MGTEDEFLRDPDKNRVWQRYCGFFDLSVQEFMEAQEHLLLDQLQIIVHSPIGGKILKGARPNTLERFRKQAPLTRYEDYAPYIGNCQTDFLPIKNVVWARTSGRGGTPKWIPYTPAALEFHGRMGVAMLILCCATRKGEVRVSPGVRVMQNLPPRPYFTGVGMAEIANVITMKLIPPLEMENEPFERRIQMGFEIALRDGVDVLGALTTILIKMGQRFAERSGGTKLSRKMLHPRIMARLIAAKSASRREKRPILPKDLWPLKGLLCYGMDTSIYREQLKYYWGLDPLEMYGGTEAGMVAAQGWNRKGLTPIPYSAFLEFIPEDEWFKSREDRSYEPATVLLNEVKAGVRYEPVLTSFYGMPLMRYRLGDLLKVSELQDEEAGIHLPQFTFSCRGDDIIDVGGFTRIDEKTMWQAIANTGVKYEDWAARKEHLDNKPVLRVYIELKGEPYPDLDKRMHAELREINADYRNLEDMAGIRPLVVTILPEGSFQRYFEARRKTGADLAHLKPPHMNASDDVMKLLLSHAPAKAPNA